MVCTVYCTLYSVLYQVLYTVHCPSPDPSLPSPDCLVLPEDVVDKIAELDLELSEGDITQKGHSTMLTSSP